jgi:hypothetical protein
MTGATEHLPRLVLRDEDSLARRLRAGQRLLASSPELVQAVVQACVAKGHRFAETPEGARWKETLSHSELMRRGRLIWQAYGLEALLEGEPDFAPSDWLDSLVAQLASVELEALLALLTEGG